MFLVCVGGTCTWHGTHVWVRGQTSGASPCFPCLRPVVQTTCLMSIYGVSCSLLPSPMELKCHRHTLCIWLLHAFWRSALRSLYLCREYCTHWAIFLAQKACLDVCKAWMPHARSCLSPHRCLSTSSQGPEFRESPGPGKSHVHIQHDYSLRKTARWWLPLAITAPAGLRGSCLTW